MELIEAIGGCHGMYGCHSYKKYSENRLTCMSGGGPIASSLLRCGQSLGTVQDKYIRDDIYSNTVTARIAANLDPSEDDFSCLPARFNPDVYPSGTIDYRAIVPG